MPIRARSCALSETSQLTFSPPKSRPDGVGSPSRQNCELKGTHGGIGTTYHREGLLASRPLLDPVLLRRVSRPGQRQLRRADDEQGPRALGVAFGFGAGIFFLAYFLFEVPSNLFLERVGARKWIARIMFTWGLLSGAMAFVGGENSFYLAAGAARHRRGRLLPRHHLLPDAVVPGGLPRPNHRLLHGGDSALHRDRRAGVRPAAGAGRSHGHEGLAVAVHPGSGAGADALRGRVLLPDRSARRRHVAGARRAGLAGRPAGGGAAPARERAPLQRDARRCSTRRSWRSASSISARWRPTTA